MTTRNTLYTLDQVCAVHHVTPPTATGIARHRAEQRSWWRQVFTRRHPTVRL
jgi:hypothetical protein